MVYAFGRSLCPARRRGRTLAALILASAVLTAGCGSSGSSRSAPGQPTTTTPTTSSSPAAKSNGEARLGSLPKAAPATGPPLSPSPNAPTVDRAFLGRVFEAVQHFWDDEFRAAGLSYSPAKLVIFSSAVKSACGFHEDAGPFYCPGDHGIYLSIPWFEKLAQLPRVGSYAQAYILGHEFGHHVQRLLTIDVGAAARANPSRKNALSVAGELQADCLAGVWAHSAYKREQLTDSVLEEMLRKAEVIGDDFGARAEGRVVDPGLFTHGSSAQRQHWLTVGFESGDPNACDTLSSEALLEITRALRS